MGDSLRDWLVAANGTVLARVARDRAAPNPRALGGVGWAERLAAAQPLIRAEWDVFLAQGGMLPTMRDLIDEDQGEEGTWRAGLLVHRGRPVPALASRFPATVAALAQVPDLWSALFSVMAPGTELPEHEGFNRGVLRYHLGIDCPEGAALCVAGRTMPYREAEGILFDDLAPHAAWNRSDAPRVTLFCEVLRPAPGPARAFNRLAQEIIALDHRYRRAPERAARWELAISR